MKTSRTTLDQMDGSGDSTHLGLRQSLPEPAFAPRGPTLTDSTSQPDLLSLATVTSKLTRRLREIEARRAATAATTSAADAEQFTIAEAVDVQGPEPQAPRQGRRVRSRISLIEQAQLTLFKLEEAGRFTKFTLSACSEYPTFLTRLPIFVPGRRSNQRRLLDEDNALYFCTPWGEGKKHGPPLTVYDEDTLIAMGHLRQNLLVGRPRNMPVPVSELYKSQGEDTVHVHVVQCMLSDIQNVCGTSQGGKNNRLRLESIKRLGATVIEFSTRKPGKFVSRGSEIKLIDVAWQQYEDNAILYVQFSPVMALWFEKEYTYIDWNLRRKLSDTGKAVHRFLSSQPKEYEIFAKKLMTTIGYMREYKKFMADLRQAMDQLTTEHWVSEWKIVGDGRRSPQKLILRRR